MSRAYFKDRLHKEPTPMEVGQKLRRLVTATARRKRSTANTTALVEDFINGVQETEGSSKRSKPSRARPASAAI